MAYNVSEVFRLQKSGVEIQKEAIQIVLVMKAMFPSAQGKSLCNKPPTVTLVLQSVFKSIESGYQLLPSSDTKEETIQYCKSFLTFWTKLGNISGFYKLANETPKTLFGDWYIIAVAS